jgi:hypothetical protein
MLKLFKSVTSYPFSSSSNLEDENDEGRDPKTDEQNVNNVVRVEDPVEEEEVDNYNEMKSKIFNSPLYKIKNKTVYNIELKEFDNFILNSYRHQREVVSKHITVLESGIKKTGYLYHPIILCDIPSRRELTIIDGQHRYNALCNVRRKDKSFNMSVEFEIIELENADDSIVMDIYRNVNTCEPVDMRRLLQEKDYVDFIQRLKDKFGGSVIVDKKNRMKYYLLERELKKELLSNEMLVEFGNEELYNKIIKMNETERRRVIKEKEVTDKVMEKCKNTNFWLGVNFPEWLEKIKN